MGQLEKATREEVIKSIETFIKDFAMEYKDDVERIQEILNKGKAKEISNKLFRTNPLQEFFYNNSNITYKTLSDDIKSNMEILRDLYKIEEKLITKMLGQQDLNYAIYYKNGQGEIYRILAKDLPIELFNKTNLNSKGLTLNGNNISMAFSKQIAELEKKQKNLDQMNLHYNRLNTLLRYTYKGKAKEFNNKVGKNMPEAFENDIQITHNGLIDENINRHKWGINEAWGYIRAASGNAPWSSGGDVLSKMVNVQVKGFMTPNSKLEFLNRANVTSFTQLEDVGNYLLSLMDLKENEIHARAVEIYNYLNQDSRWEREIDIAIEKDVNNLIKKGLKVEDYNIALG